MYEIIDAYCHYLPESYYNEIVKCVTKPMHMLQRAHQIPVMSDIGKRLELMKQFAGYRQILSLTSPPVEAIAPIEKALQLCTIANNDMAMCVKTHPYEFPGFIAALPMNGTEETIYEAERAIFDLDACGIQLFTQCNGKPVSDPEMMPFFELAAKCGVPIWIHPARGMNFQDYTSEEVSKYEIWWALGWPYETSAAMTRLVFAGVFEKWPELVIITHHLGGMIPMMEGRLASGLDLLGVRTPDSLKEAVKTDIKERPVDAFRHFYADTASFGAKAPIACGMEFFGPKHLLFASDMPFDPEQGPGYIRGTIEALEALKLPEHIFSDICSGNARRLMKIRE